MIEEGVEKEAERGVKFNPFSGYKAIPRNKCKDLINMGKLPLAQADQ